MSNQTQKNKDLPSSPIMFKTQFGQDVILAGFTKQEMVALSIFKNILSNCAKNDKTKIDDSELEFFIEKSYQMAEKFCEYLENTIEPESAIKLV